MQYTYIIFFSWKSTEVDLQNKSILVIGMV